MQEREGNSTFDNGCGMGESGSEGFVHDQLRRQEGVL